MMDYTPQKYLDGMVQIEAAHAAMDYDDDPPKEPQTLEDRLLTIGVWLLGIGAGATVVGLLVAASQLIFP